MIAYRRVCAFAACILSFAVIAHAKSELTQPEKPLIQVALLLDTSNSMDGLINQARTQLWTIVNEFARAKQDGQTPILQVALYEYGNSGLPAAGGYIRQVVALTDDLDKVSEQLFALKTNGGDEYCGQVIQVATKDLAWSPSPKVYKAIFIAGNEPFTQGTVDYRQSCAEAIKRGIIVNTIHCGSQSEGQATGWADGAKLADGQALNIDQDRAVVAIKAPQDEEIIRLSSELNKTYIAYGARGAESQLRQQLADVASTTAPAAAAGAPVQRSVSKANALYRNANWDLVDGLKEGTVKLDDVADKDLPENMRGMTKEQRKAYVDEQAKKRGDLQKQINDLNAAREKFVAEKRREDAKTGADTLDAAVLKAVREQMKQKQFEAEAK
jgi:hypothetical protein